MHVTRRAEKKLKTKAKSTLSLLVDAFQIFAVVYPLALVSVRIVKALMRMEPRLVSLIAPSSYPEPRSQDERLHRELPRKNLLGRIHAKMTVKGWTLTTITRI